MGWRTERKRQITAKSSSRWAGAITRTVEDQYQLGMRAVAANIANLRAAVALLEKRCALPPGAVGEGLAAGNLTRRVRGYRSAAERFTKSRRLGLLQTRLAAAELAWARGRPSIVVGGKRLWRSRNHLDMTGMTEQEWRHQWDAARMFLTADGESGVIGGNLTIRVDETGRLQIKTPAALVERFGEHISISMPVRFSTAPTNGRRASLPDVRCAMTSASIPNEVAGIWTRPGRPRHNHPHRSSTCGPTEYWGWISMSTTSPYACWISPAIRPVSR